jgi:hypothetical protein
MHPYERRGRSPDIAVNERDGFGSVEGIREDDRLELADPSRKACPG